MKQHAFLVIALAAIVAAGASLALRTATAETAPSPVTGPPQLWQLGAASGISGPAAWRLNTATGFMELCSDAGGTPRCDAMPAPGTAAPSAPKGLLVPVPSGR